MKTTDTKTRPLSEPNRPVPTAEIKRPDVAPSTDEDQLSQPEGSLFLILDRDDDQAPTLLLPEGSFIERLHLLETSTAPATLEFKAVEMDALVRLAKLLQVKPLLVVTRGLEAIPGHQLLLEAYPTITADSAINRQEEFQREAMQREQTPGARLDRALKKLDKQHKGMPEEPETESDDIHTNEGEA